MKNTLKAFLLLALMLGCSKDKFQTKPQLEIISTSDLTIPVNGILQVRMEYTDKEGDIDDSLFVRRVRTNLRTTATVRDSLRIKIPEFPNKSKGEITLDLGYQGYLISAAAPPTVIGSNPPTKESDSLTFKFVLRDKAGNKSDTVVLSGVVVKRQ